jgi:hypothetical protein
LVSWARWQIDAGGGELATNNDWGAGANSAEALTAAATATGAFGLSPGSRDAAVLITLAPGAYTAHVSGGDGGTGVALIEVYEGQLPWWVDSLSWDPALLDVTFPHPAAPFQRVSSPAVGIWGDLPRLPALTPIPTATANWLDAMTVAFTEAPPRRRFVRPLRQHVDLKLVRVPEADTPDIDRPRYDRLGHTARTTSRPGMMLNVRV